MDNNELNNIESDEFLYRNLEETKDVVNNYSLNEDILNEYTNADDVTKEYSKKEDDEKLEEKTNLGVISLILLGISILFAVVGDNHVIPIGIRDVFQNLCTWVGGASFLLMIYTRIKYRKDIAAKVAMWLFIIGFIIAVCAILIFIWACTSCVGAMG